MRKSLGSTFRLPCCAAVLLIVSGCSSEAGSHQRLGAQPVTLVHAGAGDPKASDAATQTVDWKKEVGDVLGKQGALNTKEQVYTVTVPRDDIELKIDGMSVPTA